MSEEKTDKQILLAEHKKANDALASIKYTLKTGYVILKMNSELFSDSPHARIEFETFNPLDENINKLSRALAGIYKSIMDSNKTTKIQEFRPIKTKGFSNKDDKMATKKAAVKKPMAKPTTKKVVKKTAKRATRKATTRTKTGR